VTQEATALEVLIRNMPKAELHVHVEGTLEPELMFALAQRNSVELPYRTVEEARAAYSFGSLQSFLDLYYRGAAVLQEERDFYELTQAYLERANGQRVRHVELFFDPQTHTTRGVPFAVVVGGIRRALDEAEERWGMTSRLIMCFLRDLGPEAAAATWEEALPHIADLAGVGLDSAEVGYPPGPFEQVFLRAREQGLFAVAHAGEEGPPDFVRQALDQLGARRIDHGVRALEDSELVERLVREGVPPTVCPLSNVKLGVVSSLREHPLRRMLELGLAVTVNSDDPAYFGGYLTENFLAARRALDLTREQILTLARNSYAAAVIDRSRRRRLEEELQAAASEL